jgi:GxxExxY protein
MLLAEPLTDRVIGLAIEVHRHTGPGLLESVYELCLCRELADAGIAFARQVTIPVLYNTNPQNARPMTVHWRWAMDMIFQG